MGQDKREKGGVLSVGVDATVRKEGKETLILFMCMHVHLEEVR